MKNWIIIFLFGVFLFIPQTSASKILEQTLQDMKKSSQEEKFVNPLFYNILRPVSPLGWENRITSSSVNEKFLNKNLASKCILLENKDKEISFECEGYIDSELHLNSQNNPFYVIYKIRDDISTFNRIYISKIRLSYYEHLIESENLLFIPTYELYKK